MYTTLLLDLDDTILDFKKAERVALEKTLSSFSLMPSEEVCARYSQINQLHWEMLERKELTREQVKLQRFEKLFSEHGIEVDSALCAKRYMENLACGHYFLPDAPQALEKLSKQYSLYLVSNGTYDVQMSRLKSADIIQYFQKIFISETVGADKPDPLFFSRVFEQIPNFDKEKTIIVGDSLTSDILGGMQAGITTCWVNASQKPPRSDIPADYTICSIGKLEALLASLNK